jgi:hypothetical protein
MGYKGGKKTPKKQGSRQTIICWFMKWQKLFKTKGYKEKEKK